MTMKTHNTQVNQRGFFAVGLGLALTALFGATAAGIVTVDKKEKQELVATQQAEAMKWVGTSLTQTPATDRDQEGVQGKSATHEDNSGTASPYSSEYLDNGYFGGRSD